jgi:hypothetical protein
MRRAHGLESDELACCEGRFVPDDDLWEKRLDIGSVANERNMCEVTPPLAPTHMGHGRWPFLVDEDRTLLIPLEQTDRCFVQVDPKGVFPAGTFEHKKFHHCHAANAFNNVTKKLTKSATESWSKRAHLWAVNQARLAGHNSVPPA